MTPENRRLQHENDLREVLATAAGRRWIWDLIDGQSGLMSKSFAGEQTHAAAYLEGRRSIGRDLMLECRMVAPADYAHMVTEAVSRQQEVDAGREQHDGRGDER
ncbi:MAG: hypothetical protein JST54_12555 [Deltaproteobacteria bacterium]|nr:hypothetical protein [Deltaproteobacteria bacterium]